MRDVLTEECQRGMIHVPYAENGKCANRDRPSAIPGETSCEPVPGLFVINSQTVSRYAMAKDSSHPCFL